ncbi:ATP-binding protein, partial [Gammaproteobacteria bacterium]|nr:ATP-binding protein [Gammaproteobacteria bacterium]
KSLLIDIADLYEPLASEKTINFILRSTGHPSVRGDRDLLFQAISNLVDNAIKYVPEGGGIELVYEDGPKGSRLSVNDTGPGIPTEEKERVFERFYRLSEHRDSIGNGLGLSLVNAVAKFHQTKVLLEDNHPGLSVVWDLPHA